MSYARFFNGATEGSPYDIYFGDQLMASGLNHGDFTEYDECGAGEYPLSVYYAGSYAQPIFTTLVTIPSNSIYTYTLSGLAPNIALIPLTDSSTLSAAVNPMVRFVHLSVSTPAVDCYDDNDLLWSNIGYGVSTQYTYLYPGTRTAYLYPSGTTTAPILTVPNVNIAPNSYYSYYTYGSPYSTAYPLKMHIPLDGHSYIQHR
jgi:hypothetical protein